MTSSRRKKPTDSWPVGSGGDEGNRTPDLLNAIQALSQLSYAPGCMDDNSLGYNGCQVFSKKNSVEVVMRAVIQRVSSAKVSVSGQVCGEIGRGFLVLLGFSDEDTEAGIESFWQKLKGLRLFSDAEGKINLALDDIGGEVLIVSQFTLYADLRRGRRPSFVQAAPPEEAERLYEAFLQRARQDFPNLQTGIFGASMEVELTNSGPFTLILDSRDLEKSRRG